jgi:hypothetical protein
MTRFVHFVVVLISEIGRMQQSHVRSVSDAGVFRYGGMWKRKRSAPAAKEEEGILMASPSAHPEQDS